MSNPKEVTRAELEGRLESARLLHESIRAREDAERERGQWRDKGA